MVSMVINATPVTFANPLARPKTPWLGVNSQSKILQRWHGSASSKAISHWFLSLFCAWFPSSPPLFKTSMVQISVTFLWLLFKSISHTVILLTGPLPSLYVMLSFDSKSNSVLHRLRVRLDIFACFRSIKTHPGGRLYPRRCHFGTAFWVRKNRKLIYWTF